METTIVIIQPRRKFDFRAAGLAFLLACVYLSAGETQAGTADIPQSEINALQQQLAEIKTQASAAKKRRSCKTIVRKGESLIEASPAAANRFETLSIVFQSQKLLLGMDNSDRNRKILFEICTKLVLAPDTYALHRLEADLLLSDIELTSKNASNQQRVNALTTLITRYRDTPGEAKCLMIAARIARKLEASKLEKTIVETMSDRFADDPDIIDFRFKNLGLSRVEVPFSGTFKRTDGVSLSFPIDRAGHVSIVVFWSQQMPGHEDELKQINEQLSLYSEQLKVFSFNVDQLPDAGEKQLRSLGLEWTAMHLPGGKNSREFRIFGAPKPAAHLVGPYGHVLLVSGLAKYGRGHKVISEELISEKIMPHARYLAQLQSLFIGDFLALDQKSNAAPSADSVPEKTHSAIQACFTEAPMRYRLTSTQAHANYAKAEKLCREAIAQFPKAPDLWRVRNCRVIALLGMWNLAIEPKHLDAAAVEARKALAAKPPKGADVVSHFCLTKIALRQSGADVTTSISNFIKATGDTKAPAIAYAAATILTLDGNSKDLHAHYRQKLLEIDHHDPMLWPVVSYLRDRYHIFQVLQAINTDRERKVSRRHIVNVNWNPSTTPFPSNELKTLDGDSFSLPKDTNGKLTLLLMVEPPTDPGAEMALEITGKPAEGKKRAVLGAIGFANKLADDHIHKDLKVVVAFLSDDTDRIKALVKKHAITCQVAIVPGGLNNPIVRQLGVLSADRFANVFLLRRNGTMAWQTSGLKHKANFGHGFSVFLGMTFQTELCEIVHAYKALEKGDFKKAADLFAGPFPKKKDERFYWTAPRFHARALANMKLKQWDTALEDIDKALADHTPKRFRHHHDHPCESRIEMLTVRAIILKNLGRAQDAKAAQKLASPEPTAYTLSIYEQFHSKLKVLRLKQASGTMQSQCRHLLRME